MLAAALLTRASGYRGFSATRADRVTGFYLLAAMAMLAMCWGPSPRFLGRPFWHMGWLKAPYAYLLTLPGFDGLRVPSRFGLLWVLCLSVAAALVLAGRCGPAAQRGNRDGAGLHRHRRRLVRAGAGGALANRRTAALDRGRRRRTRRGRTADGLHGHRRRSHAARRAARQACGEWLQRLLSAARGRDRGGAPARRFGRPRGASPVRPDRGRRPRGSQHRSEPDRPARPVPELRPAGRLARYGLYPG